MRALMLGSILASCAVVGASAQASHSEASPAGKPAFAVAQSESQNRSFRRQGAPAQSDAMAAPDGVDQPPTASVDGFNSRSILAGEEIAAQLGADSARLDELMDAALARGNARILAVKPVTR